MTLRTETQDRYNDARSALLDALEALAKDVSGGHHIDPAPLPADLVEAYRGARAQLRGELGLARVGRVTFTDEQIADLTDGMTSGFLGLMEHISPKGRAEMRRIWDEEPHRRPLFRAEPPAEWAT